MAEPTDLGGDDAPSLTDLGSGDAESLTERIHLALIAAMRDLHRLEEEASTHPRGSRPHAELSAAVERQAREVYRLARYQLDRAVEAAGSAEGPERAPAAAGSTEAPASSSRVPETRD
jgi:hypothetical protein